MQKRADDHPSFVKMNIRGQTTEGRNITVMKLGTSPKGTETPAVWFDAGKLKIKKFNGSENLNIDDLSLKRKMYRLRSKYVSRYTR